MSSKEAFELAQRQFKKYFSHYEQPARFKGPKGKGSQELSSNMIGLMNAKRTSENDGRGAADWLNEQIVGGQVVWSTENDRWVVEWE